MEPEIDVTKMADEVGTLKVPGGRWLQGSRKDGTNPRALGTNPRAIKAKRWAQHFKKKYPGKQGEITKGPRSPKES